MIDVLAEDDGLVVAVGGLEKLGHLARHKFRPLFENQGAVEVALVVDAVVDDFAVLVAFALLGPPALQILVEIDADHLVGGQEAIFDALLERVDVDRLAEVVRGGDVGGFLGRGGQSDLRRR